MRVMEFLNYKQRPYTNVTVRKGYKWADLKIGETISLAKGTDIIETAWVKQVVVKRFCDIKPEDIKREHDPSCTTRNGLYRSMIKTYLFFGKQLPVTIVTYVRPTKKAFN